MIEAILFDMDGTIFDTERLYDQSLIESADKLGITITKDDFDRIRWLKN